jgi:hypothetical protein
MLFTTKATESMSVGYCVEDLYFRYATIHSVADTSPSFCFVFAQYRNTFWRFPKQINPSSHI